MITLRIGYTALPYGPSYALRGVTLRTGPMAGSLSLRLRAQTARHMPVLVCALRSPLQAPLWACPTRFALSRCGGFTTRGFPSTRTNPGPTGWVLSICPRSGPSALFRTPPRFGLGRDRSKLVAGILSHLRPFVHPLFLLTAAAKTHAKSVWMLYNIVKSLAVSRPAKEVNRL